MANPVGRCAMCGQEGQELWTSPGGAMVCYVCLGIVKQLNFAAKMGATEEDLLQIARQVAQKIEEGKGTSVRDTDDLDLSG